MQNYQNIPRKFDFSTKNMSIFAQFYPQINSRVYTAIRYHRVTSTRLSRTTKYSISFAVSLQFLMHDFSWKSDLSKHFRSHILMQYFQFPCLFFFVFILFFSFSRKWECDDRVWRIWSVTQNRFMTFLLDWRLEKMTNRKSLCHFLQGQ